MHQVCALRGLALGCRSLWLHTPVGTNRRHPVDNHLNGLAEMQPADFATQLPELRKPFANPLPPLVSTGHNWRSSTLTARWRGSLLAFLGGLFATISIGLNPANGQTLVLRAHLLQSKIHLDGALTEAAWFQADSIANLTMVEPKEGAPPSNRTVVRVLTTRQNLYVGVRCYDTNPSGIVAYSRTRDPLLYREDYVALVLDTFNDGRMGYIFKVNPLGARYDALVMRRGEDENSNWDTVWEAKTQIDQHGWTAEIRIPVKSLSFRKGARHWGFNIERRIQRFQETDRWSGASRDYELGQTSHAGRLTNLPMFDFGLGLTVEPSVVGGFGQSEPGANSSFRKDASLDVTQRFGPNLEASLTVNTDFAETEVDARQTNLTRFPLFFPEKRAFFLRDADIFEFGLGLGRDLIPFFTRTIGLYEGQQVPLAAGLKVNGRVGGTNLGAFTVHTRAVEGLVPAATMGVVRIKQNIWSESSVGFISTFGDPTGVKDSWVVGTDFTYQTSRLHGNKNFLVGLWGLYSNRPDLAGDKTAVGLKIDYPNDLWDLFFSVKRIGDAFEPSLGWVPRPGTVIWRGGGTYSPRPSWKLVRQMFHEFYSSLVTDLDNEWESYRVFMAPINWRLESGDRFEFNVVPQGERLIEPFEIAENVVIPSGSYHWLRYRLEGGLAAKRKISGQLTWWFGQFYTGRLDQFELWTDIKPSAVLRIQLSGEVNVGRLPEGHFTQRLYALRLLFTPSPDVQLSSFIQYDNESNSLGSNTRLRWTFSPEGALFVVYNHNVVRNLLDRWSRESYQFLLKVRYAFRR